MTTPEGCCEAERGWGPRASSATTGAERRPRKITREEALSFHCMSGAGASERTDAVVEGFLFCFCLLWCFFASRLHGVSSPGRRETWGAPAGDTTTPTSRLGWASFFLLLSSLLWFFFRAHGFYPLDPVGREQDGMDRTDSAGAWARICFSSFFSSLGLPTYAQTTCTLREGKEVRSTLAYKDSYTAEHPGREKDSKNLPVAEPRNFAFALRLVVT